MNRITVAIVMAASLMATTLCGCGNAEKDDSAISNFDVHEVLKSASRSFAVKMDEDTFYLSVFTSIHWPVKFGDSDLTELRDSLLSKMYRTPQGTDVDEAILAFVGSDNIFDGDARLEEIDSIPLSGRDNLYEIEYTAKLMELTERTVTYQINNSSYLGGAHPNYSSSPFTYDLVNSRVLTYENLFKPGSSDALLGLIKEQLAAQEGVSVRRLQTADIFVDQLYVSPLVFLNDGGVVFRYNPYDIAPYYKGIIDVELPAYVVEPYLTESADRLINQ